LTNVLNVLRIYFRWSHSIAVGLVILNYRTRFILLGTFVVVGALFAGANMGGTADHPSPSSWNVKGALSLRADAPLTRVDDLKCIRSSRVR